MNYKAIIDAGFNSFRVSLYSVFPNGSFRLSATIKEYVRLGMNLVEGKEIPQENVERAEKALRRFGDFLRKKGVTRVRVLGTSAFRLSANGNEVARRLSDAVGFPIEMLSGEDEGRLSARGALNSLPVRDGVAFDLGGGSLEVAYFKDRKVTEVRHFPLGALRLLKLSPDQVAKEARDALSSLPKAKGALLGSGGNVRALARIDSGLEGNKLKQVHGYSLPFSKVERYSRALASMGLDERAKLPGVDKERALTIHTAAVVVRELMEALEAPELVVSAFGLREGVALEAEIDDPDRLREFWLEGFSYWFGVEPFVDFYRQVMKEAGDFYVAAASYKLQVMRAAGFVDPYSSCYKVLREMLMPGLTVKEVKVVSGLCAAAKKYKKKYYDGVKDVIDKGSFLARAKVVRDYTERYQMGVEA
ncbi:MAG: Ppx/GppA phosphatase family protein [Thermoprotei archaeon]